MSGLDEPVRQTCPGCRRSLKIRLDAVPEEDFTIQCPKCNTEVVVRVSTIRAAMGSATAPSEPTRPQPSNPPARRDPAPVRGQSMDPVVPVPDMSSFGAMDLTDEFLARQRAAIPEGAPIEQPSISLKRTIPRNAPRTSPKAAVTKGIDFRDKLPPPPILAAMGGGGLIVLALLVWLLWPSGTGPVKSSVESDRKVQAYVQTIRTRYPDPGGDAAELFGKGIEKIKGDSSEDHRAAAEYFRKAIAANPAHPEPLAALALNSLFLTRSDRDGLGVTDANMWADYVHRQMPGSILGGAASAVLFDSLGREAEARELAERQVSQHDQDALAWFVHGHIMRKRDPKAANNSLKKATELDPGFRIAFTEQADVQLTLGHVRAAHNLIVQRHQLAPPAGASERVAADIAYTLGDFPAGLAALARAAELEPKDVDLRLQYGWRLSAAGNTARAREQARFVLDVARGREDANELQAADAQLLLSDAARREGKGAEAVSNANAAGKTHPSRAAARYQLGLAQLVAGRPDLASEALREAAAKDPKRVVIHLALGLALAREGRYDDAVASLRDAQTLDAGDPLAHALLADVLADNDLATPAVEAWEAMMGSPRPLDPLLRSPDPRFPRPQLDLQKALARVHMVENADPNRDARYRMYEGALLCESGRINEGLQRFSMAGGVDPGPAAYISGWLIASGRAKDAVRMSVRAETAAQLAAKGWALKVARMPGADAAFAQALNLDNSEPFANLGSAQLLIARGKTAQALPLIQAAQRRLGMAPPVARALFDAGE